MASPRDDPDLPVVEPGAFADREPDRTATVAGVVLAGGTSSRFGEENKLLATVAGEPIVRRAVRTVLDADVHPVVVVVGHEADRIEAALDGLDVEFVRNPNYERGQSTSLSAGIDAVRGRADAALVALGDMPRVSVSTVDALVAAFRRGVGDALAAASDGTRGNPVLFDATYFDELADVEGDVGGRRILLASGGAALVETGDEGVLRDVDTPDDLESFP